MKRLFLALAIAALLLPATRQAEAGTDVSIDFFYNNLGAGGNWVEVADYGYAWQPSIAVSNRDWRPYTDGYWAYTDVGWTWISNEDFGWATYHYGRWARVRGQGWVWVPGREWAPAWVSWRTGGDHIGWAPLPPRRGYNVNSEVVYEGRPINGYVDIDYDIGPSYYNFVDIRYIGGSGLRSRILPPAQNITYISSTVNVTDISYNNSQVYNRGPDYERVSRYSSQPIPRLKLQRESNVAFTAATKTDSFTKVQGDTLMVAAPQQFRAAEKSAAPKAVKTKIAQDQLETGWSDVSDAKAKTELQEKMKKEDRKSIPPAKMEPRNPAALTAPSPTPITADVKEPATTPAAETAPGRVATSPVPAASATPVVTGKGRGRDQEGASPAPSVRPAPDASPAASVAPTADQKGKRDQMNKAEATAAPVKKPEAAAPPVKGATPPPSVTPPATRGEENERGSKIRPKPAITPAAPLTTPSAESKPVERSPKRGATETSRAGGSAPGAAAQNENAAPGNRKAERPTAAPPIKRVNEAAPPPREPAAMPKARQTNPPETAPQGRPAKAPDAAPAGRGEPAKGKKEKKGEEPAASPAPR